MTETDTQTARDFIYAGRRVITGGRIGHAIFPIGDDGELMDERLYDLGKYAAAVGGQYRGATFGETKSIGVAVAKFIGARWPDRDRCIDWEAEDKAAEIEMAGKRLAADAKRKSEIDAIMLPLRRRYDAARRRGDYGAYTALRQVVLASLEKPPRENEK